MGSLDTLLMAAQVALARAKDGDVWGLPHAAQQLVNFWHLAASM
jgi:hypothetical protein